MSGLLFGEDYSADYEGGPYGGVDCKGDCRVTTATRSRILSRCPHEPKFDLTLSESIILVDEVDYDFDHRVFFFSTALGYHQRQGYKCIICYAFSAILVVEDAVAIEKP